MKLNSVENNQWHFQMQYLNTNIAFRGSLIGSAYHNLKHILEFRHCSEETPVNLKEHPQQSSNFDCHNNPLRSHYIQRVKHTFDLLIIKLSIHAFTLSIHIFPFWPQVRWYLSPMVTVQEVVYTLDRSDVYHRATKKTETIHAFTHTSGQLP